MEPMQDVCSPGFDPLCTFSEGWETDGASKQILTRAWQKEWTALR